MKYDVVLLEKDFTSGLNIHEVISLMNKINCEIIAKRSARLIEFL